MPDGDIHLASGLLICWKEQSWCGTEFIIDYESSPPKVTNGTKDYEKATCKECRKNYEGALAKAQRTKSS